MICQITTQIIKFLSFLSRYVFKTLELHVGIFANMFVATPKTMMHCKFERQPATICKIHSTCLNKTPGSDSTADMANIKVTKSKADSGC